MTTLANVQANLDRSQARLDTYEVEDDAYTAYMKRQAGAWKEQEQVAPVDRVAEVLQHKLDQLQQGIQSAERTGEITGGYLAMLEVRADSVADEIDEFIKARRKSPRPVGDAYQNRKPVAKKSAQPLKRALIGDAQATLDAAFKAKQQRMANAWKDGQSAPEAAAAPDLKFGV